MKARGSRSRGHVHSIKATLATPLGLVGLVDDESHRRLRAVSVTTVEELLGVLAADADAVGELLPDPCLERLRSRARDAIPAPVLAQLDRAAGRRYRKGALPPEQLEAEECADAGNVFGWLDEAEIPGQADDGPMPPMSLMEHFGPVRDQGNEETSVAHAACALLEHQQAQQRGLRQALSARFLYWRAKRNDGAPREAGTRLRVALPQAAVHGACLDDSWPGPQEAVEREARDRRLLGPTEVPERNAETIRCLIEAGRPVAITVPVYDCWDANPASHLFGLIPMPLPGSHRRGGQALCVVGYGWDSEIAGGGYFIVRNSWGTHWAPRSPIAPGYGALPFLYLEKYGWEMWTTDEHWDIRAAITARGPV